MTLCERRLNPFDRNALGRVNYAQADQLINYIAQEHAGDGHDQSSILIVTCTCLHQHGVPEAVKNGSVIHLHFRLYLYNILA